MIDISKPVNGLRDRWQINHNERKTNAEPQKNGTSYPRFMGTYEATNGMRNWSRKISNVNNNGKSKGSDHHREWLRPSRIPGLSFVPNLVRS